MLKEEFWVLGLMLDKILDFIEEMEIWEIVV